MSHVADISMLSFRCEENQTWCFVVFDSSREGLPVSGDLFDMLLPMLSIYQEYVRNHHYSLQVLTECKQTPPFAALLSRLENKPACQGRSLETFLTYPMHQVNYEH